MSTTLPNERLLGIFGRYSEAYLRRHFHSVRLLRSGDPQPTTGLPLVVYLNHAAWWDPLTCLLLAQHFFDARQSYAPIAAQALGRYRFFQRLGFFPVTAGVSGAKSFLRQSDAILASSSSALWITPQGHFADARSRPVSFQCGLSHIASRVDCAAFMPLALEYVHWEERLPEILVSFGQPLVIDMNHQLTVKETTRLFEGALTSVQDHLSAAAQRRDGREWTSLLCGRGGVGGVYQMWNRARAMIRGQDYRAAHSPL
jgi:hypothetical protein